MSNKLSHRSLDNKSAFCGSIAQTGLFKQTCRVDNNRPDNHGHFRSQNFLFPPPLFQTKARKFCDFKRIPKVLEEKWMAGWKKTHRDSSLFFFVVVLFKISLLKVLNSVFFAFSVCLSSFLQKRCPYFSGNGIMTFQMFHTSRGVEIETPQCNVS